MTLLLSFDAVASDSQLLDTITKFWHDTGIMQFFEVDNGYLNLIMILVSFLLMYLAIVKKIRASATTAYSIWYVVN